jgi:hypothetical protein
MQSYSPRRFFCRSLYATTNKRQHQRGATLVEFNLVVIPLLLMGLFIIEAAHWQIVRQFAQVALLDAARAGATAQRRPEAIEHAFRQTFTPQQGAWQRFTARTGLLPWQIEIQQPSNTDYLRLSLTYLHEPLAPITRALIKPFAFQDRSCQGLARQQGLLPINVTLQIEMHSDPIPWQSLLHTNRHRPVIYGSNDCSR